MVGMRFFRVRAPVIRRIQTGCGLYHSTQRFGGRRAASPFSGSLLVPEVAHAGEDHGQAGFVGGRDHLVVAHRAAGLDDRGGAGFGRGQQPVGEGEEGVRGDDRALGQRLSASPRPSAASAAFRAAMRAESTRLIWPGADADGGAVLGIDDGVRLDVLGDA